MAKVLIVDDVKFSIEMTKQALLDTGCEFISATNGKEAIDAALEEKPDLILMDLYMPTMNGDDSCRVLKSDPRLSGIPVVIVTSMDKEENLSRCKTAGCNDILIKPFKKGDIRDIARKYVNIRCRLHKRYSSEMEVFYASSVGVLKGRATDISLSGMLLKSEKALPVGENAAFTLAENGSGNRLTVKGKVVRNLPAGDGMGIMFEELPEGLKNIVEKHQGRAV